MLDQISNEIVTILSTSVCGVSIATIIGMVIYIIRVAVVNRRNMQIQKEAIEKAFQDAVLPKTIKLDISNKIDKPIKEGLLEISQQLNTSLEKVEQGERLMLSILILFTHFQKLPEETRQQITDFLNDESSVDITL